MKTILPFFLLLIVSLNYAADWPQFRGPERTGVSTETGLLTSWPENGPALLWSTEILGGGWSSAAVVENKIYITGEHENQETLFAFDLDGNLQYRTSYGPTWQRSFPKARTTPTVDGDRIYVNSGQGNLVCFERSNGEILWQVQTVEKFDGDYHRWGIAESPLIIGDKVIATPGGENASVVALNKMTGETVWVTEELSEKGNYCSPIHVNRGGTPLIITMLVEHVVGIHADNGDVLWQDAYSEYQKEPKDINPVTPVYHDGYFYTTSGYDCGGAMYKLSADGTSIERVWVDETLDNHHGHVVKIGDYIYGSNWINNREGNWVCLDWKTGEVKYETNWRTKGSIITADGYLYCYEEKDGHVALAKPDPSGFHVISEFQVPLGSGEHWAHPSISDGRLYIRHGEALMVYKIN